MAATEQPCGRARTVTGSGQLSPELLMPSTGESGRKRLIDPSLRPLGSDAEAVRASAGDHREVQDERAGDEPT